MFSHMENNSVYDIKSSVGDPAGAAGRAFDILEFLENQPDAQTLTQIADGLGLPKASAHRLLVTLRLRGYVDQARSRGGYTLGLRVLRLAARARERLDLPRLAAPRLRELAVATGESCQISIRSGLQALCVARIASPAHPDLSLAGQIGSVFPLHASAVGKVLLAFAPAEEQAAYLARDFTTYTPHTAADRAALTAELGMIRRVGIAHDDEEYKRGLCALAVPIFEPDGSVRAAVGVPYLTGADGEHHATALRAAASAISIALGWTPTAMAKKG